jgi:hypothetical protein
MAKKRKSLMDALSDYQGEHGYGPKAKGAVKGQGPVKDGKTYGKLLKKNQKEDKTGPKGVLAPKHDGKPPKNPPPVSRGGGSGSGSGGSGGSSSGNRSNGGGTGYSGKPGEARQQATVTRENRNRGTEAGGIRNTGGRGTTPKPSSPKPKRSDFGTGRTGAAAYNRAVSKWKASQDKPASKAKTGRNARRGTAFRK